MLIRNVHYLDLPDLVIVTENGRKAMVEFPVNVTEVEKELDGETFTEYIADTVYYLQTIAITNLKEKIMANYEAWLERAKIPESKEATINDVIEAINVLQEIILGGDF